MAFDKPFKLEINHNNKTLAFGPRRPNEIGRDILAVKIALGIVEPAFAEGDANTDSSQSSAPLDTQNWFDCGTGSGMTIGQASTYDLRLKNALINFQILNLLQESKDIKTNFLTLASLTIDICSL